MSDLILVCYSVDFALPCSTTNHAHIVCDS